MNSKLLDRFLRYVRVNTQSMHDAKCFPSTEGQFRLARILVRELKELGISDAKVDDHCYVIATLPSNIPTDHPAHGKVPAIGFVAHLDTSPDFSGENVSPNVIKYEGGDISIGVDPVTLEDIIIRELENPILSQSVGHTIVTTDGKTLLGADDKAGIAAIMMALELMRDRPEILHGDIMICFNPDEEVGKGMKYLNKDMFQVKCAYTVDGGASGVINKETFSADTAVVTIFGRDIHTGTARGKMINAVRAASDLISWLPKDMCPETTDEYEPFIHPCDLNASVGKATIKLLFRDFDTLGLKKHMNTLEKIIENIRQSYPGINVELRIEPSYRNMREKLETCPEVLDNLVEAVDRTGMTAVWKPIRGGTDGATLTAMGIPTPNIFMGGANYHGRTELVSIDSLGKTVETLLNLAQIWVEKSTD